MLNMIMCFNESLIADMSDFGRITKARKTSSYNYVGGR